MGVKEIIDKHIYKREEKDEGLATPAAEKESPDHDEVSSVDDGIVDEEKAIPVSKREKVKRHCGRFKWYYVAGVMTLLVILLPVIFKVVIPRIIKNVVDNQALPVISGSMVFTSSDTMSMALNTSLNTPISVVLKPVGLALYAPQPEGSDQNKSPFITVQMPEQYVDGKTEVEIPTQTALIQDKTQLVAWFNDYYESETTELRVQTENLVAHIGKLSYTVSMDKTIRVQGLNSLQGFAVSNMSFIIPADANGTNVVGILTIPNPGVLTLSMGNVTFTLWASNLNLGTVTAYDLVLKPGNNTPVFQGHLYLDQLVNNLNSIINSQSGPVSNGYIELNATGNSTFYNGNRISYIENVLNSKKLLVRIPTDTIVNELLNDILVSGSGSGSDGSNSTLLGDVGQALSNLTLLDDSNLGNSGGDGSGDTSSTSSGTTGRVKRAMDVAASQNPSSSARTNLFRGE